MSISRRNFLKGLGAASAVAVLPSQLVACGDDDELKPIQCAPHEEENFPALPKHHFRHGVASGDPLSDAVIIWTRYTSQEEIDGGGKPEGEFDVGVVDVQWEIALDRHFEEIVNSGETEAEYARDYTVKVDVSGLEPETTYYYRFTANGETSPMGRTKTAPVGDNSHLRLAFSSCASYAHGYFNSYAHMADEDIDAVVFLGDYIYEYGNGGYGSARDYDPPHEIISLEDYRRRYAWYRVDPDLQAAHQQHPFILVWDDHEIANNSWKDGAQNHNPEQGEGDYHERLAAAQQAYFEWLPIREAADSRIWRKLQFGNLLDLVMLDTRIWGRDEEAVGEDADREMLGEDQYAWMDEQLRTSSAHWKFLGQQVMFAQLYISGTGVANTDQWDGYQAARERVMDSIEATPGGNVVILTGDIHTGFANDVVRLPRDPEHYNRETGEGSIAVEFVCTSISSPGLDFLAALPGVMSFVFNNSPHIKYLESAKRGYTVLDVDKNRVHADFKVIDSIAQRGGTTLTVDRSFTVDSGAARLREVEGEAIARRCGVPKAPLQ